tara:strand:+ start:642 stop:1373 length:732 start_codon:yes stop_codon:yes gene_type:complete
MDEQVISSLAEALKTPATEGQYVCDYCNRGFRRDSTLAAHMCEPKRRKQQEKEPGVQLGFQTYLRFFELSQGSSKLKSYDQFMKENTYIAFVKFGRHIKDIRAVNPRQFIDFVLTRNKKIDHWCREKTYEEYLFDLLKTESSSDALERSIIEMGRWAEDNKSKVNHFFLYCGTNELCFKIVTGRVSPWVIYNCESGRKVLQKLGPEQLQIVMEWIDPDFWNKKFSDYMSDAEYIRHVLGKENF